MRNEKSKKKDVKENRNKHVGSSKNIIGKIKNYCLKDTGKTVILMIIMILLYFLINWGVGKINLAQIDFTKDKLYSLSDSTKDAIKNIGHDTTVYVWGYSEDSTMVDLLKQYNRENSKITYEIITKDKDPEVIAEYYLNEDYPEIVVKSDLKTTYIDSNDMYSYDLDSEVVDMTEQKLTNSILDVNLEEKPKVYFLEGKSQYSLSAGIAFLAKAVDSELYEIESLNLTSAGAVPEDCDILSIISLQSDLTDAEKDAIIEYINKGGNIFIAKDISIANGKEFPNFQAVLDLYGISMPNKFIIETGKMSVAGAYGYLQANVISDNEITRRIYNAKQPPILYYPGKIEVKDSNELAELKTTVDKIVYSTSESLLVDVSTQEQEEGTYTMGVSGQKVVSDGVISKFVIFSSAVSFSDASDTRSKS